jgi:hypothetical protein
MGTKTPSSFEMKPAYRLEVHGEGQPFLANKEYETRGEAFAARASLSPQLRVRTKVVLAALRMRPAGVQAPMS